MKINFKFVLNFGKFGLFNRNDRKWEEFSDDS